MAEIPESTVIPPPSLEQRMERLEGNFGQNLGLLKTLIPDKEIANDNSNNNDNGGGGPSIQTNGENPPKVVIVTESFGPDENVEDAIREGKLNGLTVSQDKLRKPGFKKKRRGDSCDWHRELSTQNYAPSTSLSTITTLPTKFPPISLPILPSKLSQRLPHWSITSWKSYPSSEVPQPVSNPPPKWYNPAETCKYHMGTPGHMIEKCWTFKLRVQRLRGAGRLYFKEAEGQSTGASVDNDPLLMH
ncbi:hypothetical protein SESBI_27327 [Sesbania bispinosa]|nr:hypothetical protein SESBI_27327 [Sesbania bispinosa]